MALLTPTSRPAASAVGDIVYSPTNPDSAKYFQADGSVYTRSAYPALAALRPDPAFVASLVHDDATWTHWSYYYVQRTTTKALSNDCINEFDTATETFSSVTPTGTPSTHYATQLTVTPSGTLYAVPVQSRDVHKSTDGVAWTRTVNALPEAQVPFFQMVLTRACTSSGRFYFPFPTTFKYAYSDDGVTFTLTDSTGDYPANVSQTFCIPYDSTLIVSGFAPSYDPQWVNCLGGRIAPGPVLSTAYGYQASGTTIPFTVNSLDFDGSDIIAVTTAGVYKGELGGGGTLPSDVLFSLAIPITTADRLLFADGADGGLVTKIGWLSPDKDRVENALITKVFPDTIIADSWFKDRQVVAKTASATYVRASDNGYNNFQVWKLTLDSSKFHAPGLSPIVGAYPWVRHTL